MLGVGILITVLSVMNGFENELRKRILGVIPHIVLEKKGGFISSKDTIEKIASSENIFKSIDELQIHENIKEFLKFTFSISFFICSVAVFINLQ